MTGQHMQEVASVRYLVHDIPTTVSFYTKNFGFEALLVAPPEIAVLRRGVLQLVLTGPASAAAATNSDGSQPRAGGWNRIQLMVDDIREVVRRLSDVGVVPRSGTVEGKGGVHAVVDDPSGNPVELFQTHS